MAGRARIVSDKWSGLNAAVQHAAAEADDDAAVATFLEKARPAINALVRRGCAAAAVWLLGNAYTLPRLRRMQTMFVHIVPLSECQDWPCRRTQTWR